MLAEIFMVRLETRRRQAISQEGSNHGNSGQEFIAARELGTLLAHPAFQIGDRWRTELLPNSSAHRSLWPG
jgi:hypothetical protein